MEWHEIYSNMTNDDKDIVAMYMAEMMGCQIDQIGDPGHKLTDIMVKATLLYASHDLSEECESIIMNLYGGHMMCDLDGVGLGAEIINDAVERSRQ